MKTSILTLFLILNTAFNAIGQKDLKSHLLSQENLENELKIYNLKSDAELLNLGFYKINQGDSIDILIKNKQIESLVDYTGIDIKTADLAKERLKANLNCTGKLFLNSRNSVLRLGKSNASSLLPSAKNGETYSLIYASTTHHLFPSYWFGIMVADSLKTKGQFSRKIISLPNRGDFFKIDCHNDQIPRTTSIPKLVKATLKNYDSLSKVMIWFPNTTAVFHVKPNQVNEILNHTITNKSLTYKEDFKTFSANALIGCISYHKQVPVDNKLSQVRPDLEIFFTIKDTSNQTLIISDGYPYTGYECSNINKLRDFF